MDPALFLADLESKPQRLRDLADILRHGDMRWPASPTPSRIVLLGMGSSLYAAQVAAHRLRAGGAFAVAESASAERLLPCHDGDLVVGISAGGTSMETNQLFATVDRAATRVALTNVVDSAISGGASSVIDMAAGPELGGVACRSYTHTLVALLALEHHLLGTCPDLADQVSAAADATDHLLDTRASWLERTIDLLAGPDGTWIIAPLERLSSAMQGALMLREGPRRAAVGCETGDWSHVDVYLTKTLDYRALVHAGSRWDANAADWLVRRSATVVSLGGTFPGTTSTLRHPGDDDPIVALLTETIVAELIAATLWRDQPGLTDTTVPSAAASMYPLPVKPST